jgi:hypothetical protein
MLLLFQILIFLVSALSIVIGLFTALKAGREDLAYRQVFLWLISPVTIFAGMVFLEGDRRRDYISKVKSDLFIKNK